jgi:hypothetical protein
MKRERWNLFENASNDRNERNIMGKKNTTVKRVAATTALGVGLVAGGAGIASASSDHSPRDSTTSTSATPPSPANFAGGVVTAVSSSSISVKDAGGTTNTYTISSSTTFSEGPTTVTESALAVGQHVGIQLSTSDDTAAASIDIQLPALFGTVSSVDADTVVITDLEGFSRTIVVDSSTSYTKSGAAASLSDVVVGSDIIGEGTVDANGTSLDATHVVIGVPSQRGGPGIGGPGGGGPGFSPPGANGAGPQAE